MYGKITYMYNAKERFLLLLERKKKLVREPHEEDIEKNISVFEAGYNLALEEVIDEVKKLQ